MIDLFGRKQKEVNWIEHGQELRVDCIEDKALEIIDRLKLNGYVNNRERGVLRRALLEERPQGKWQLHGMIYYCSECGHECGESGDNFCGNCGADMRGGRE